MMLVVSGAAFEFQAFAAGHAVLLAAHLTLITLLARCFMQRRQTPPSTFALVGAGLISGGLAAALNTAIAFDLIEPSWDLLARRLPTEGMFLMFVLGVGGFLGPRLLGFADLPKFTNLGQPAGSAGRGYALAAAALLCSLIAEYGFGYEKAVFLRAAIATVVLGSTVQPWRLPAVRTTLAWCVWTANLMIIGSVWLIAFMPAYRVDFLHVLFIGGFTLLILAVGTRVTLSHGGHPLSREKASWPLRIGLVLGLIAMLARIGAPFAPVTYFEHLALAALLWIAGIGFWGFYLVGLMRKEFSSRSST
jgi:uncharacterized protein involved in response to NO